MTKLSEEIIDKMTKQEACQSILFKHIKECIEEFGCEPTRDAIEWFSMVISKELAEEYFRENVLNKPKEITLNDASDASVDKINAA